MAELASVEHENTTRSGLYMNYVSYRRNWPLLALERLWMRLDAINHPDAALVQRVAAKYRSEEA